MLHVYIPYRVHAHNGICKENWVVLDVGTTEVKKPCKEEIHILFYSQNEGKKVLFHNIDNPVVIFLNCPSCLVDAWTNPTLPPDAHKSRFPPNATWWQSESALL